MKNATKILLACAALCGVQLLLTACVAEVSGPGYYEGGAWFHDGPWMDGGGWRGGGRVGVGVDIHPPHFRR